MQPHYRVYPFNAEACANITRRSWNPPVSVVKRWIEMCMAVTWIHAGLSRAICLEPLDIHQDQLTLMNMKAYVELVGT